MRSRRASALAVLAAVAVPLVLVGNALWLLLTPSLVDLEYALPGFPDPYAEGPALSGAERERLADAGIESVRPFGDGVEALRREQLPDGEPAFGERELAHMQDVRDLIGWVLRAWALALALALVACLRLRRRGGELVRRALVRGAALTAAAMALVCLLMLVDFELFFDGFHGVFFEGDSWRFNETYTLRSLYPDLFWVLAGALAGALVLAQAAALALWAGRGPGGARELLRGPWASPGERAV